MRFFQKRERVAQEWSQPMMAMTPHGPMVQEVKHFALGDILDRHADWVQVHWQQGAGPMNGTTEWLHKDKLIFNDDPKKLEAATRWWADQMAK